MPPASRTPINPSGKFLPGSKLLPLAARSHRHTSPQSENGIRGVSPSHRRSPRPAPGGETTVSLVCSLVDVSVLGSAGGRLALTAGENARTKSCSPSLLDLKPPPTEPRLNPFPYYFSHKGRLKSFKRPTKGSSPEPAASGPRTIYGSILSFVPRYASPLASEPRLTCDRGLVTPSQYSR